jgi:hypothetical protein
VFLALVGFYTWPLARDPGHLLPANVDPRLFSWVMLTIFRNLVTDPALLFHGNAFYPMGSSLALAEPLLIPALMAGPLFAVTRNPVLAYNLTLICFWALSGWAMYVVAFQLTRQRVAAFAAGLVFTFAPYRMDHYREFQMEMAFGIPLAVFTLVRFLETQRARYLMALLVVFGLQAASVWYYAIILALGLSVVTLQVVALRWTGWRLRPVCGAGVAILALALALSPVAAPYFHVRQELNYSRGLDDAVRRSADVLSYVEARANWLYRSFTRERDWEASLFLGVAGLALVAPGLLWLRRGPDPALRSRAERWLATAVWLALAVTLLALLVRGRLHVGSVRLGVPVTASGVALLLAALGRHASEGWRRWRTGIADRHLSDRDWVAILLGLAGVAFFLSLGPIVALGGRPLGAGLYAWLWPYLLPLHAIRGPTRIGVLFLFSGALLAAYGVAWLRVRWSPGRYRALVGLLGVGLMLEYAWMPLPYQTIDSVARPVDAALRADPRPAAVLEWPTNIQDTDADAMFRSLAHGKRVVNGLSGFVPALVRNLSVALTTPGPVFPVPEAQAALRRIYPLRYLVVRLEDPAVTEEWRARWRALRTAPPPSLEFRGTFGSEDLYEAVPTPERGARLERWVSYDLLRRHPALTLRLRPVAALPDRDQWAEVWLNEHLVRRIPLSGDTLVTLALPPPGLRAAPNVIALRSGYRGRPSAPDGADLIGRTGVPSPGDLRVVSVGEPHGSASSIRVNGTELSPDRRGYNLVAVDRTGLLVTAKAFDTFADDRAATGLAAWIDSVPPGTIVAGAVRDEGSARLTASGVAALQRLGVEGDLRGRFREAHAFVGVKGAPPGTALEALGPRPIELRIGRPGEASEIELLEFRLDPVPAPLNGAP